MITPEDDIFDFIKYFKEDCQNIYGVSVDVTINTMVVRGKPSISKIIKYIEYLMQTDESLKSNVKTSSLRDKTRFEELITYRQCAYWFLRNQNFTCKAIAKMFKQSHSTVIHGTKAINTLIDVNDAFTLRIFNRIKDELKNKFAINTVIKPLSTKRDNT
jgi:hypothetical protein